MWEVIHKSTACLTLKQDSNLKRSVSFKAILVCWLAKRNAVAIPHQ